MKVIKICVIIFIVAVLCPAAFGDEVISGEGWTVTVKEIPYGDGPGEVGTVIEEGEGVAEGSFWGPKSFTLDKEGNVYILDNVNKKVQVYSSDLNFLYSIPVNNQWGELMIVDNSGNIFILDRDKALFQYDHKGRIISHLNVNLDRWGARMFIRENKVYMEMYGNMVTTFPGFIVIAKIVGNGLKEPSNGEKKLITHPLPENSGRRYLIKTLKSSKFQRDIDEVKVLSPNNEVTKSFNVISPYSFGVWRFLGDDNQGRLYYEIISKNEKNKKFIEIHQYGPAGEDLRAVRLPEMPPFFHSNNSEFLKENGTFYRFVPEREVLKIVIIKLY